MPVEAAPRAWRGPRAATCVTPAARRACAGKASAARAATGTRSLSTGRAWPRVRAAQGAPCTAVAAPQVTPLSALDEHDSDRVAIGISELDRVLGGGTRRRLARAAGRRAGHRQVDARAGHLRRHRARHGRHGARPVRIGRGVPGQLRLRAARLGLAGAGAGAATDRRPARDVSSASSPRPTRPRRRC